MYQRIVTTVNVLIHLLYHIFLHSFIYNPNISSPPLRIIITRVTIHFRSFWDKIPNESNLRKEVLIGTHGGRVQSIMVGKSWWQELEARGQILVTVRKQWWMQVLSSLSPVYKFKDLSSEMLLLMVSRVLLTSINLSTQSLPGLLRG